MARPAVNLGAAAENLDTATEVNPNVPQPDVPSQAQPQSITGLSTRIDQPIARLSLPLLGRFPVGRQIQ